MKAKEQYTTEGFMLLRFDQQTLAKSKAGLQGPASLILRKNNEL